MTRVPCRNRTGDAVLQAENFGDLVTAYHKDLDEGGESRSNHRYSVVVLRSGHSMDSIWSVQNENFSEDPRKILEPSEKPKAMFSDNSFAFGKTCEDIHGVFVLLHPIDPRQKGLLKEPYEW